nr:protein MKS1-like [Ipomoea trifida]
MDMSDVQSDGKSPRRELQGPRPAPLRVRKDSHKIRKPPVAPSMHPPPQAPPRPPVIIYTVSPKIIHANPSEFMSLVQRLTGPDHAASSSSSSAIAAASSSFLSAAAFQDHFNVGGGGAVSPAARFAAVERTRTPQGKKQPIHHDVTADIGMIGGMEIMSDVERSGFFPGVLSPNPSSLPPIPPNFFSPPSSDQNPLGFFADFISPGLHNTNTNNRNSFETTLFMPSPSTINSFISPGRFLISPGTPSLDFFNNIFDL